MNEKFIEPSARYDQQLAQALLAAQINLDHHAEAQLIFWLFPKRASAGAQHARTPLQVRLLTGCTFGATDCWHWTRARNGMGYGRITYENKMQMVHRLSYRAFIGSIPEGMSVLHTCDNRVCINPEHLWLGTYSDNLRDCWAKGRHPGKGKHHGS